MYPETGRVHTPRPLKSLVLSGAGNEAPDPGIGRNTSDDVTEGERGRLDLFLFGYVPGGHSSRSPGLRHLLVSLPFKFERRPGDPRLWAQVVSIASSREEQWPFSLEELKDFRESVVEFAKKKAKFSLEVYFYTEKTEPRVLFSPLELPLMEVDEAVRFIDHWLKEDLLLSCKPSDNAYLDSSVVKITWLGTSLRDAAARDGAVKGEKDEKKEKGKTGETKG